mgnify:CR=1 FL=1
MANARKLYYEAMEQALLAYRRESETANAICEESLRLAEENYRKTVLRIEEKEKT